MQEDTQVQTTPPLPGPTLVAQINAALATVGSDFYGASDPAAQAWPGSVWASTSDGLIKRRNGANTTWMPEGVLNRQHIPVFGPTDVPTQNIGPIYITGAGLATWNPSSSEYESEQQIDDAVQWLGTPIGGYITPLAPPPTDDIRFRYVLCTAGQTGVGGYNEGILTGESVSGSAPLLEATATVALAGSPFDGQAIHLINTEGRFVAPGVAEAHENDKMQVIVGATGWRYVSQGSSPKVTRPGVVRQAATNQAATDIEEEIFDSSLVARTGTHTQPRAHRLPHYRRIL